MWQNTGRALCLMPFTHRAGIDVSMYRSALSQRFAARAQRCALATAIHLLQAPAYINYSTVTSKLTSDMAFSADFNIPPNVITKIILETVTEDIAVQEDFIKALSRATSLFILYSTTRANEVASENNRRSVYSQDVLHAISALGFDHLVPELINWHSTYMEEKENLKTNKKKKPTEETESKLETINSD